MGCNELGLSDFAATHNIYDECFLYLFITNF